MIWPMVRVWEAQSYQFWSFLLRRVRTANWGFWKIWVSGNYLWKFQQAPGTYPRYPKYKYDSGFPNHKPVVEGLGYVPGVCWSFLRNYQECQVTSPCTLNHLSAGPSGIHGVKVPRPTDLRIEVQKRTRKYKVQRQKISPSKLKVLVVSFFQE